MSPDPISRDSARHAVWDDVCDAYYLLDRSDLAVVHEVMPPGASSEPHAHQRSRQFFYVLSGTATVVLGRREMVLGPGSGLEVPPRTGHAVRNDGEVDVELLVISSPRVSGSPHGRPARRPLARDRSRLVVGSHLRRTRRSDLATVVDFEEALGTRQFLGQGGREWHERVLTDPDMEHWVLVDRLDRVLAFGILAGLSRPDVVEIRRMVVAPEARGQGVGRILLRHLLQEALVGPQVHHVWLDVSSDNTRARSLYRTFGFVEKPAPPGATLLENGVYMEWSGAPHTLGR